MTVTRARMSGWLALLTWALAASALHLRGRRQLVRVARAGHEVRGPLCTAQLALDGLERSARVEAIEPRAAAGGAGARRPLGARAGARPSAAVDVGALLSDAAQAWRALAEAHGVTLAVEPGGAPRGRGPAAPRPGVREPRRQRDRARPVGRVHVRSSAVGGRVRIEVRDGGPGLPAPVAELVAAARGRRSPRGHGLAIAAAVAERHGGRLASLPAARGAHLVLELPEAP